ncbi:MAG: HNH endonuclease, partial [Myxococcota bacterium]
LRCLLMGVRPFRGLLVVESPWTAPLGPGSVRFEICSRIRRYGVRWLGLSGRQVEERLRVGRALRSLPRLDGALARGELFFTVVRELTRVATPDTEERWVSWARAEGRRRSYREVERAVASRTKGQSPDEPADPRRETAQHLHLTVSAEAKALFLDMKAKLAKQLGGGHLDDSTLVLEMARQLLADPGSPTGEGEGERQAEGDGQGRAPYQVAVHRCDACGGTSIDAGGETLEVDKSVADMIDCDAQYLPSGSSNTCYRPDKGPSPRAGAGRSPAAPASPAPKRATQVIAPAVRRAVLRRDHLRCRVPGCQNHRFLDLHHVRPRARGGTHEPDNLVTLCGAHHRLVHRGHLVIQADPDDGAWSFFHADGARFGTETPPQTAAGAIDPNFQLAVGALHRLGFSRREAERRVRSAKGTTSSPDLTDLIRAALSG